MVIGYRENDKTKNCNIMRQLKNENGLEYFFNYALSLDLFLIENYLEFPK